MKNIFDFKRFANLVHLFFVEHGYRVLLYYILSTLGLIFLLLVSYNSSDYSSFRAVLLLMYLIINLSISLNVSVQYFKKSTNLSDYIMLPNSILEKMLLHVMISGAFYMSISLILFKLIDYTIVIDLIPKLRGNAFQHAPIVYDTVVLSMLLFVFMFFSLISLLFFVINKLNKILIAIGFVVFLVIISVLLNYFFFSDMYFKTYFSLPFGNVTIALNENKIGFYDLEGYLSDNFMSMTVFLPLTIFGFIAYYYKLKEQQIRVMDLRITKPFIFR